MFASKFFADVKTGHAFRARYTNSHGDWIIGFLASVHDETNSLLHIQKVVFVYQFDVFASQRLMSQVDIVDHQRDSHLTFSPLPSADTSEPN